MGSSVSSCGEGLTAFFLVDNGDVPPLADLESLDECLWRGDTVLVKGRWLLNQSRDGIAWLEGLFRDRLGETILPHRQELPEEALWSLDELRPRLALSSRRVKIVSVSYRWLGKDHPDQKGEQLRTLLKVIEIWYRFFGSEFSWDLAIFLDWCSLFQEPRLPWEEASFRRATSDIYLWYAHQWTDVWILPDQYDETQAHMMSRQCQPSNRAWPIFERAVSELAPSGATRAILDLSGFSDSCEDWESVETACCLERNLPVTPQSFRGMIREAPCSIESDRAMLKKLYTEAFRLTMSSTKDLFYQSLGVGDAGAEELGQIVKSCPRLLNLFLSANGIGDTGAAFIALALPSCHELTLLALDDNRIGLDGAKSLAAAIPCCRKLAELRLSMNTTLGDAGVEALAPAIPRCNVLKYLALDGVGLTDDGAASVLPKFAQCQSLLYLNLAENLIGDSGAVAVAAALPQWRRLEQLVLSGNRICDRGVAALANGISHCRLNVLLLSRNLITNMGAQSLAAAFPSCRRLTQLSLESNKIDDVAAVMTVSESWKNSGKRRAGLRLPEMDCIPSLPRRRNGSSGITFMLPGKGAVASQPRSPKQSVDTVFFEESTQDLVQSPKADGMSDTMASVHEDAWVVLGIQNDQSRAHRAVDDKVELSVEPRSSVSSDTAPTRGYEGSIVEVTVTFEDKDIVATLMKEAFEVAGISNYAELSTDDFYVMDALGRATDPQTVMTGPLAEDSFPMTWRYAPDSLGPVVQLCSSSFSGATPPTMSPERSLSEMASSTSNLASFLSPADRGENELPLANSPNSSFFFGESACFSAIVKCRSEKKRCENHRYNQSRFRGLRCFTAAVTGQATAPRGFVIEVRGPSVWHTVERTFQEFGTLHSRCGGHTGALPPMPPKKSKWSYFDFSFMDKRQDHLGRLLTTMLTSDPRLTNPELREFLGVAPLVQARA